MIRESWIKKSRNFVTISINNSIERGFNKLNDRINHRPLRLFIYFRYSRNSISINNPPHQQKRWQGISRILNIYEQLWCSTIIICRLICVQRYSDPLFRWIFLYPSILVSMEEFPEYLSRLKWWRIHAHVSVKTIVIFEQITRDD